MSRLLENILSKNQKINFDFSKSFNRQNQILDFDRDNQLPVHPKESSWETIVDHQGLEVLQKNYKFKTLKHLIYFTNELLKKADSINHHPEILITEGNMITVSLYTHDLNQITELDIDMSKHLDEIYEDIFYIQGF